jgi:hypothetical protein
MIYLYSSSKRYSMKIFIGLKSLLCFGYHRWFSLFHWILYFIAFSTAFYIMSIVYYSVLCSHRYRHGLIEVHRRHLWNTSHGVHERFMPILMPVCDRAHYLTRVLNGLHQVNGINEVNLSTQRRTDFHVFVNRNTYHDLFRH